MKNNPTPWVLEGSVIRDANGEIVLFDHSVRARTVACINALAGWPDEDIALLTSLTEKGEWPTRLPKKDPQPS